MADVADLVMLPISPKWGQPGVRRPVFAFSFASWTLFMARTMTFRVALQMFGMCKFVQVELDNILLLQKILRSQKDVESKASIICSICYTKERINTARRLVNAAQMPVCYCPVQCDLEQREPADRLQLLEIPYEHDERSWRQLHACRLYLVPHVFILLRDFVEDDEVEVPEPSRRYVDLVSFSCNLKGAVNGFYHDVAACG